MDFISRVPGLDSRQKGKVTGRYVSGGRREGLSEGAVCFEKEGAPGLLEVCKHQLDEPLAGITEPRLESQELDKMTLKLPPNPETVILTASLTKGRLGPDSLHGCILSKEGTEALQLGAAVGEGKVVCSPAP